MTLYIGADVDCKMTDIAVESRRKIVDRYRVPTTIACLREILQRIGGHKELAFEEGPLAHWLYRNLQGVVDRIVVCDPRRNAYIAKDGDKDDPIDARKLAELLRGGFLREVYHSDDDGHVRLKRWVGLYHDRVHDAVRQINKIRGVCRFDGLRPPHGVLRNPDIRSRWLSALPQVDLRLQLQMLWLGLDAALEQVRICCRKVTRQAKTYPIIDYWRVLPGVGIIRAATLYAYLDTPWRFRTPGKLCKYCGVGIERASSGKDRFGKPKKGLLQLAWAVNKRLKDAVVGATISAINQGKNPFAAQYRRLLQAGLTTSNARHTVARKLLTVMWGMWKTNRPFDPALLAASGADY